MFDSLPKAREIYSIVVACMFVHVQDSISRRDRCLNFQVGVYVGYMLLIVFLGKVHLRSLEAESVFPQDAYRSDHFQKLPLKTLVDHNESRRGQSFKTL